ncbi:F-box protein PP2-B10 [Ziziphus jujuba]|uniref:F-box protein PP2-B10 n=1 Tax=Ziziphus jujuba TaxID=326968 RepID=A0A6P6GCJ2_ZIZJJ|nr:F-box protein PP2-B10 [Ziziphus jujuba]
MGLSEIKARGEEFVYKNFYKEERKNYGYGVPEKISSEGKQDISEGKIGKKADDQGVREPEMDIKEEKEKGKAEMGITVHNENAYSSLSVSSSSPCAVNDDSDAKSESLLPENIEDIISRSDSESKKLLNSLSMNDLYFHLCKIPIFIDKGTKSISIDEGSGKICCMIGAKGLTIEHAEASECWQWKSLPETYRFSQVAESKEVWFLHIKGQIRTNMLSSKTTYGVYFVYKFAESISEFHEEPVELCVKFKKQQKGKGPGNYLDPSQPCQDGREGWREIEMGEFFIEHGENEKVVCILMQKDNDVKKAGLIVDGIEFRPKNG